MQKKYPKIGLALGSGAAKGIAHIGVLKILEENNIPIDYIAGSSIGALIGAHYAAFKESRRLEELIINFNRRQGFQLFDPTLQGGIVKGNKFEEFIAEMLEGATFDSVQIPFAAVATDFRSAKSITFTQGNLVKAIRASTSVPAFFQPVTYKHQLLADGGLSNPIPVEIVRQMGADIVIAVNLDTVFVEKERSKPLGLTQIPLHSINILRHNLALHSTKTADIVISPHGIYQMGLIGWDYFVDTEKAKSVIQAGEDATEEIIPALQSLIQQRREKKSRLTQFVSFFRRDY